MKRIKVPTTILLLLPLFLVFALYFYSKAHPHIGDWDPSQEKTSTGCLTEVSLEQGTFTLEYVSWCALADGNDINGVVTFSMDDRDELARMKREIPIGTRITVEHEREYGVVSDKGQLKAQDYWLSELLFFGQEKDKSVITTGKLTDIDTDARTITLEDVNWSALADSNAKDGSVVFGVDEIIDLDRMARDIPAGSYVAVVHYRHKGVASDPRQLMCECYLPLF